MKIQARPIFLNSDQSTDSLALTRPVHTTEPTLQCVDDIGILKSEATRTVIALANSITKPLEGVILVRSSPIVLITLLPSTHKPTLIPTPINKWI